MPRKMIRGGFQRYAKKMTPVEKSLTQKLLWICHVENVRLCQKTTSTLS